MELVNEFVDNQLALCIPVALVLIGAILVFAFGFKSAEQPPFDKLSSIDSEERKSLGKKRKLKEKKSFANGSVVNTTEKTDKSPSKELKKKEQPENVKKAENNKTKLTTDKKKADPIKDKIVENKNKKNVKTKGTEKPVDFDDGNWETVPTKGDKKKKQDSPAKKENKSKKVEKPAEIDRLVKEVVNKEVQEIEKVPEAPLPVAEVESKGEEVKIKIEVVVKKEKKSEKKPKTNDEVVENNGKEDVEPDVAPPAKQPAPVKPQQAPAKVQEAPVKVQEAPVKVQEPYVKSEEAPAKQPAGGVAFDELGDVWTEAKQPKKSKKKTRRDN